MRRWSRSGTLPPTSHQIAQVSGNPRLAVRAPACWPLRPIYVTEPKVFKSLSFVRIDAWLMSLQDARDPSRTTQRDSEAHDSSRTLSILASLSRAPRSPLLPRENNLVMMAIGGVSLQVSRTRTLAGSHRPSSLVPAARHNPSRDPRSFTFSDPPTEYAAGAFLDDPTARRTLLESTTRSTAVRDLPHNFAAGRPSSARPALRRPTHYPQWDQRPRFARNPPETRRLIFEQQSVSKYLAINTASGSARMSA